MEGKAKTVKRNSRKKSKSSKRTNLLRQNSLSSSRTSLNCFGSLEGLNKLFGSINFGLTYERSQSMIDLPESMDIEKDEFNRNRDHFKVIEKKRFMITYGDEDDDENNDREYDAKNNDNDNDNTNNMNDHNNNNDDETKND